MLQFLGNMAVVGVTHVVVGVFLYYGRVAKLSLWFGSDFLVFLAPALLAFSGYFHVAWSAALLTCRFPAKLALVALIALVATAISWTCMATVAFNRFGT